MFLNKLFYHNTMKSWLVAFGVFIVTFIVLRILKSILHSRIRAFSAKTETDIDDLIADLIGRIKLFFLLIAAFYAASHALLLPQKIKHIIGSLAFISLLFQSALLGTGIITYWISRYKKEKLEADSAKVTTFTAVGFVSNIILWSVILLLGLDNLGVNITTLIAGLGVGGIAMALAVQNVLGDLFASLSIILDKPFVIGDFIVVDDYLGTIEYIGLKSTRLRSLSGEQLIFSNTDLLKSRIRNFQRMIKRRVVFTIGVTYQTPPEKLKMIPEMIKKIIESQELTQFDRAHFKEFGDFSLNYEVVYWIGAPDYKVYMDIHQTINIAIFEKFQQNGIEFAYPTQTLFINQAH